MCFFSHSHLANVLCSLSIHPGFTYPNCADRISSEKQLPVSNLDQTLKICDMEFVVSEEKTSDRRSGQI